MVRYRNYIPFDLGRIILWMGIGVVFWWFIFGAQEDPIGFFVLLGGLMLGPFTGWLFFAPLFYMVKLQKYEREQWDAHKEQRELNERRHNEWVAKRKADSERNRIKREEENRKREESARIKNERYREQERQQMAEAKAERERAWEERRY